MINLWDQAKNDVRENSIPDCKEEGCDRKVVTVELTAKHESVRKPEYTFPGCAFVPPQPHETEEICWGADVVETCAAGHEIVFFRYPDGRETTPMSGRVYIEFKKES